MRMLFVANPVLSHLLPMVPLAWACRASGHDVLVATSSVCEVIRAAGLSVVDVSPGFDTARWEDELTGAFPELEGLSSLQGHATRFAAIGDAMSAGLSGLVAAWRPDLVVHSEITTIGAVVAARHGVPAIRHDIEICDTTKMLAYQAELLENVFGHQVPAPGETITVVPGVLASGKRRGAEMRYVPYNGGHVFPGAPSPNGRPRVVITDGTTTPGDEAGRLGRLLDVAAGLEAEFVLAISADVARRHAPLPPNVHAPGWVPLSVLLRSASALIHHGGAGTTMNAVCAGVPQLALPDDVPRRLNAEAVRGRGAALTARPEEVDAALIGTLLTDPALREGAARLAGEVAAMPSPCALVPALERAAIGDGE